MHRTRIKGYDGATHDQGGGLQYSGINWICIEHEYRDTMVPPMIKAVVSNIQVLTEHA
jgi:hypothetical protein